MLRTKEVIRFTVAMSALTLVCSIAFAADEQKLRKAAAFVLSGGREDFEPGPAPGTLVTADHNNLVFQSKDDPCTFQYRYNDWNRPQATKIIVPADFHKMRKWWIGVPYMGRLPRIQLRGDRLGWCKLENVSDDVFNDPTWTFSSNNDRGCTGFVEMIINRDNLERVRDAFSYISANFCPYEGQPY